MIFWEVMTLSSQFLVAFERGKKKAVDSAFKYFAIAKVGADFVLLLLVFFVVVKAQTADMFGALPALSKWLTSSPLGLSAVLFALIAGFGAKSALVPLHSWLPDAHPEAPSNVSALLSGAMIKVPIYALLRFASLMFPKSVPAGVTIAAFGVGTIVVGTMYALMQKDSKRLLAFCSVGKIGYIIFSAGAGIFLLGLGGGYAAVGGPAVVHRSAAGQQGFFSGIEGVGRSSA
jgi:hydrogenase-4 component B